MTTALARVKELLEMDCFHEPSAEKAMGDLDRLEDMISFDSRYSRLTSPIRNAQNHLNLLVKSFKAYAELDTRKTLDSKFFKRFV